MGSSRLACKKHRSTRVHAKISPHSKFAGAAQCPACVHNFHPSQLEKHKGSCRTAECTKCTYRGTQKHIARHEQQHKFKEHVPIETEPVLPSGPAGGTRGKRTLTTHDVTDPAKRIKRQKERISECEQTRHTCDVCDAHFARNDMLTRHASTHRKGTRSKGCSVCLKTFFDRAALKKHMRRHERLFKCVNPDCLDRSFATAAELREHIQCRHTPSSERRNFVCAWCPTKQYQSRSGL